MQILLNGKPREVDDAETVGTLVARLGYAGKRIAVERNGEIVPRSRHDETRLAADDRVEIVVAVGGG
ncbi:MAG: sulfur carrier protein ThiS [Lautropia sp.]